MLKLTLSHILLTLIIGVMALSPLALQAQATQRGVVLLYRAGQAEKTPLPGVSLTAQNAGAAMSGDDGTFTLKFRTLHAGDAIQFRRVEASGYEVMDRESLEGLVIGNEANDTPLRIVMCLTQELDSLRDGYRSVAAQRYQQQLAASQAQAEALRKQGKIQEAEYQRRMDELESNYQQQLESLDAYVDKFARLDLTELDAFEQEIMALVSEGRFEEAIAKYEEQDLSSQLQQGEANRRQLQHDQLLLDSAIQAKDREIERLERVEVKVKGKGKSEK